MSLIVPTRRGFLLGLGSLIAAPALVLASSLMPVSPVPERLDLTVIGLGPPVAVGDVISLDEGKTFWACVTAGHIGESARFERYSEPPIIRALC